MQSIPLSLLKVNIQKISFIVFPSLSEDTNPVDLRHYRSNSPSLQFLNLRPSLDRIQVSLEPLTVLVEPVTIEFKKITRCDLPS